MLYSNFLTRVQRFQDKIWRYNDKASLQKNIKIPGENSMRLKYFKSQSNTENIKISISTTDDIVEQYKVDAKFRSNVRI